MVAVFLIWCAIREMERFFVFSCVTWIVVFCLFVVLVLWWIEALFCIWSVYVLREWRLCGFVLEFYVGKNDETLRSRLPYVGFVMICVDFGVIDLVFVVGFLIWCILRFSVVFGRDWYFLDFWTCEVLNWSACSWMFGVVRACGELFEVIIRFSSFLYRGA